MTSVMVKKQRELLEVGPKKNLYCLAWQLEAITISSGKTQSIPPDGGSKVAITKAGEVDSAEIG